MPKATMDSLLPLWYQALSSPLGIEVQTSDLERVRAKLYNERREVKDADLDQVAVCQSPFDPLKIWLVKRKSSDGN